ncbi:hypothetical protein [Halorussus litoreus]|uniref:hypothetical protein n=1 Tax=Halorussus litoreus TaxID=1710536 RepID=UPI000E225AE1|nr:hypothetical protein [Halorussus litoreus]
MPEKQTRRETLRKLSSASLVGLSAGAFTGSASATGQGDVAVIHSVPFNRDWSGDFPHCFELNNGCIAGLLQDTWDDEFSGDYVLEFDSGSVYYPVPESAFNGRTTLNNRAEAVDEYLKTDDRNHLYDDYDAVLILDYNDEQDKYLGDAGSYYGTAGGSDAKVGIIDAAFFENPSGPFAPDGFYGDTHVLGTAFRAIASLYGFVLYQDATTSDGEFSLAARDGYQQSASCGTTDSANGQAAFVSSCTKNRIKNHIDDIS